MKLAMFIVFENVRGFILNILSFFAEKKTSFWTFWELLSHSTIRDAFYKKFATHSDFWKNQEFSSKQNIFFSNDSKFRTFWELLSIITIWDAFQSFFELLRFWKDSIVFFRKKPTSKRFENFWAKTQFETDCTSNLPNYSILTKNSSFFIRKTPFLFPRKSKVWKFWEVWAKIPFETHSIEILLISAIFKNI